MNEEYNFDEKINCSTCRHLKKENESLKIQIKNERGKRKCLLEAYKKLLLVFEDAIPTSSVENDFLPMANDNNSSFSSISSDTSSNFIVSKISKPHETFYLHSKKKMSQDFKIFPPSSQNKPLTGKNISKLKPTLSPILPKRIESSISNTITHQENSQQQPSLTRKNLESLTKVKSLGSLFVEKSPAKKDNLLVDSLNLETLNNFEELKNNGEDPWYFVDINGDKKLKSWPKPSSFLAANNSDFIRRSEERQRLIQDASKRRALVSSYRRAVAHDVINGNVNLSDAIDVLTIDPSEIRAFPEEEIIRETKKKIQSSYEYLSKQEKKKRQSDLAANRLIAHCFNMSHFGKNRLPKKQPN